jgi:hypothetical protein
MHKQLIDQKEQGRMIAKTNSSVIGISEQLRDWRCYSMFDFLIKHKTEQELKLSVRQRALNVFSNIEGLDDIKEMMLRALESPERAHTLLIGPPACAYQT